MTRVAPVGPLIITKYYPTKTDGNRIETLIRLVGCSPRLVVTGTNQSNFNANTQIGKTSLFKNPAWQSYLKKNELCCYHHNSHHGCMIDADLSRAPVADIYVLDEIHSFLPGLIGLLDQNLLAGYGDDRSDGEVLMDFWEAVSRLSEAQRKLIFITALHPQSLMIRNYLESPSIIRFFEQYRSSGGFRMLEAVFQSPILELPERKQCL
ncbi:MAG: hypothetical protein WC632_04955 [Candidatus Margulisiibacteriota bacterium]